jgi:hypothetical protein
MRPSSLAGWAALAAVALLVAGCGGGALSAAATPTPAARQSSFDTLPGPLKAAITAKLALSPDSSLVVLYRDDRLEIAYVPADNSFFVWLHAVDQDERLEALAERFLANHGVGDFSQIKITYRPAP